MHEVEEDERCKLVSFLVAEGLLHKFARERGPMNRDEFPNWRDDEICLFPYKHDITDFIDEL